MASPSEIAGRRELLLVDIRPRAERYSELGFVPASLSLPLEGSVEAQLAQLVSIGHTTGLVLYCLSGHRSASAWASLARAAPFPLAQLEGGLLAWAAAGLPVCRIPDEPGERPADVLAFRRQLLACFVAESTEVALDHQELPLDPCALLEACFRAAGVSWDQPAIERLDRVLDRVGITLFQMGRELQHIADAGSVMRAALAALERTTRQAAERFDSGTERR